MLTVRLTVRRRSFEVPHSTTGWVPLRHPHIVSYYGCHWSDENHLQMYLEYMAGGSLSQAHQRNAVKWVDAKIRQDLPCAGAFELRTFGREPHGTLYVVLWDTGILRDSTLSMWCSYRSCWCSFCSCQAAAALWQGSPEIPAFARSTSTWLLWMLYTSYTWDYLGLLGVDGGWWRQWKVY